MLFNYGSCVVSLCQSTEELYTLIFETNPVTTDINLIAPGYQQVGNTIRVPFGTIVLCEAYLNEYVPYTTEITVTQNTTFTAQLDSGVQCTINTTPADASVAYIIDGYEYNVNPIKVHSNESFTYIVSKEGYATKTRTVTITEPTTFNVELNIAEQVDLEGYEYTLDGDSNVTLTNYVGNDQDPTVP